MLTVHEHPSLDNTEESMMSFFFAACLGDKWELVQLLDDTHNECSIALIARASFSRSSKVICFESKTFLQPSPC
jgi:hypothetical protein